jgi:hypothetical protein
MHHLFVNLLVLLISSSTSYIFSQGTRDLRHIALASGGMEERSSVRWTLELVLHMRWTSASLIFWTSSYTCF